MTSRSKDVLSVEQMAGIVGVGRQTAYAQCRRWLASNGADGIPCRRVGRLILVYRYELETWLGFPIEAPSNVEAITAPAPAPVTEPRPSRPATQRPRTQRRPNRTSADQTTLPF